MAMDDSCSDIERLVSESDLSSDDMERDEMNTARQIEIDARATGASNEPQPEGTGAPVSTEPQQNKKRKGKKTTSPWWKHFIQGEQQADGSFTATCNYCGHVLAQGNSKSTRSLKSHIKKGCKKVPRGVRFPKDALQKFLQVNTTVDQQSQIANWVFDQLRCRTSFARMVIAHEYPFNCVHHHFLKAFLNDLQPEFKMVTRNTLKAGCLRVYEDEKDLLYDTLGKLDCKLSFTSDLWTCKGGDRGFMTLTCHYIDENWQIRKRLLSFHPLPSPHTGRNISQAIHQKLVAWNVDKKVFSLVLDNASSNDACIKDLLSISPFKRGMVANGDLFHQRCGCHILNLIVQEGLNVLTTQIQKVRETMKYIRGSQQRMEKYKLAASQAMTSKRKPAWDVPTRWNSTYMMLELALELKEAFIRYATMDTKYTQLPNEQDWKNLEALVGHLKVFYDATTKLSGSNYSTLNLFFTEFCEVYLTIRKMQVSPYPYIVQMSKGMFDKWDKYWSSGNALLSIACILDPRCKFHVVDYYSKEMSPADAPRFMANLHICLHNLFTEYAKAHSKSIETQSQCASSQSRGPSQSVSDTRAGLKDYLSGKKVGEPIKTELEEYLSDPLDLASMDEEFDILSWWKLKAPKFPILARLTRDVLAIPISTVASESTFSTAGRTLSSIRSSLSDQSIQALLCAQDWLRTPIHEKGGVVGDVVWSADEPAKPDDRICGSANSGT